MSKLQDIFLKSKHTRVFCRGQVFELKKSAAMITEGVISTDRMNENGGNHVMWIGGKGDYLNLEGIYDQSFTDSRLYTVDSSSATITYRDVLSIRDELDRSFEGFKEYHQVIFSHLAELDQSWWAVAELPNATSRALWAGKRLEQYFSEPQRMSRKRFGNHICTNDLTVSKIVKNLMDSGELSDYLNNVFFRKNEEKNLVL